MPIFVNPNAVPIAIRALAIHLPTSCPNFFDDASCNLFAISWSLGVLGLPSSFISNNASGSNPSDRITSSIDFLYEIFALAARSFIFVVIL